MNYLYLKIKLTYCEVSVWKISDFLISTLILLVGCQSNKVNNDVYFDKITSISWLKPDENEVNFNKEDSEKILDILSKAELSSDNEETNGGLWLKAYTDDNQNTVLRYAVIKISVLVLIRSTSTKYPKAITIL